MQTWPEQHAKARFSEFLETCLNEGPQIVTRRGVEAAVLVPADEWRLMHNAADTLYEDAMIAATARVNKLVVATRNVGDFRNLGVKVVNPFTTSRR